MAGYDAKRVAAWLKKQTGQNLVPTPRVSKTCADQRREAAEKELDKFDINKQPNEYEQNPKNGLYTSPMTVTIPAQSSWYNANALSFYTYRTLLRDDKAISAALKAEEEAKRKKLAAFKNQIDAVGNSVVVTDPVKPASEFRVPDIVGTLTAWRGWKVSRNKLSALGRSERWLPKMATPAQCSKIGFSVFDAVDHEDEAPSLDCTCGYWSFRTLDLLKMALEPYIGSVMVIGQIDVWGKVIECENGYRSEFAYPKELWLLEPGLDHLGWAYGVPIRKAGN